jgi:hypothetical protein
MFVQSLNIFMNQHCSLILSTALIIVGTGFHSCSDEEPEICTLHQVEEKGIYPPGASQLSGYTRITTYEYSGPVLNNLTAYEITATSDIQILDFSYDSQNRLISGQDAASQIVIAVTYDSENRIAGFAQSYQGVVTDRFAYEYNSSGQLVKASYYSIMSSVMTLDLTIACEYPNGQTNNFHTKKYFYQYETEPFAISAFEWDSQKSPYEHLPLFLSLDNGDNNITKVTTNYSAAPLTDVKTYTYTYNSKGYPTKRTYTRNDPAEFTEEITYEYTCKK